MALSVSEAMRQSISSWKSQNPLKDTTHFLMKSFKVQKKKKKNWLMQVLKIRLEKMKNQDYDVLDVLEMKMTVDL